MKAVDTMIADLQALQKAPVVDPFTGPAILSGRAAAVFFHEVFGDRIEGQRQKNETEGQTFKKMVGQEVLPKFLSIDFDPTLKKLGSTDLVGAYQFDDEGVRAQPVVAVKDGVLQNFLMGRSPIDGFPQSNGHGRAQAGFQPVARQSNLVILNSKPVSREQLKKLLLAQIKQQGKPFGLLFDDIQGGFTLTGRTIPNAFNVVPVMVYRVYPDGREELVRGVDLVGTPLTVFSKIVAADDETAVFNGICGAESGSVPVSASGPAMLISQIEVPKKAKSQDRAPILACYPCTSMPKPIVLTILDGWGYRADTNGNAIALARKPVYDSLLAGYPNTLIRASEHYVGLPDGQMGNSEVGHLNLGAGRIVRMDMTRIDTAIADGSFFTDPTLVNAITIAREKGSALHLIGLLSDGGVHSHSRHLYALLRLAAQYKLPRVFVHAFMDGRDTMPHSGIDHLGALDLHFREYGTGALASVGGRYFAMDRDLRWEKERQAFDAMVTGSPVGGTYADPLARVRELYSNGITDEFIPPFTCTTPTLSNLPGAPVGPIRTHDVVINFNYRADRARQITRVLARTSGLTADGGRELPKAAELDLEIPPPSTIPTDLHYVCMTQYDKKYKLPIVIPPESMDNILANVMAVANLRNLRVAETEKYAHVTYFFNGGIEKPFPGEEREVIPSQKVATYDLAPEMSAAGIADTVVKAISDTAFDVIIVNFANADMVGHSGKLEPTIRAVETVDRELGRIYRAVRQHGGALLVTADHGNAEMLIDPATGGPHTAHTCNPVPFIYITDAPANTIALRPDGSLRDVSPTILNLLNLHQPTQMTGADLRVPTSV